MSYIALYRKWRPSVFEDVVEQEHVVKTLKYSVSNGRIGHAYLFCGTRGTGKTTMAKIFSRAINCLNPKNGDPCNVCEICKGILSESILDVIEIDAASNNSVDNVREIRDEVIYAPSQAKYKVYIIDEVHMLSTGAFNALLKTLEEPPSHVVFILATTDPHKLPATILSRVQRFDFRRISIESIVTRLNLIALQSQVSLQNEAARLIAKMSDGALRDAISILDQCISLGNKEISYDDVLSVVGIVNDSFIADIFDAIGKKDISGMLKLVEKLVMDGKDITQFVSDLVYYYRNLLICKITNKPCEIIESSAETVDRMQKQSVNVSRDEIMFIIKELSALESSLKWAPHPRVLLEVSLIKFCEGHAAVDNTSILDRLSALERKLEDGSFAIKPTFKPNTGETKADVVKETFKTPVRKAAEDVLPSSTIKRSTQSIESWEKILVDLKNSGRMVLYTNLLDTKAVELDSKFIGIVFKPGSGFKKMLVSKAENLEVVEAVVSKNLGREVRIKCLEEEELKGNAQQKLQQEDDEFAGKAKTFADKFNIPMNIIDE